MMMVMVSTGGLALRRLILEVLLDCRLVLLGSRKVAGLEVAGKLVERRGDRIVALCRCSCSALRPTLLQRGKLRLRRGQIPGLQILAELRELLLKLLPLIVAMVAALSALSEVTKQAAAGNTQY
jgi:hypothetical protein